MCVFVYVFNSVCVCLCLCVVVPAARVAVKRYKFYVYYTLIMRVYKQITFMAQSTRSNRHRQQRQGKGRGKGLGAQASSALVPCCHGQCFSLSVSVSMVSMELTSQLPINVARMRTQIIW